MNRGTTTMIEANADGDAAAEFRLVIYDGAVDAADYRAADFIL